MLLMTYVDNLTNDQIPYLIKKLLNKGANNVHVVPAITKKGRQEHIFYIDIEEEMKDKIASFMAAQTSTIGVRVLEEEHITFDYEFREVRISASADSEDQFTVKVKVVKDKKGAPLSVRAEFKDIKNISDQLADYTFYEFKEIVESRILEELKSSELEISVN